MAAVADGLTARSRVLSLVARGCGCIALAVLGSACAKPAIETSCGGGPGLFASGKHPIELVNCAGQVGGAPAGPLPTVYLSRGQTATIKPLSAAYKDPVSSAPAVVRVLVDGRFATVEARQSGVATISVVTGFCTKRAVHGRCPAVRVVVPAG